MAAGSAAPAAPIRKPAGARAGRRGFGVAGAARMDRRGDHPDHRHGQRADRVRAGASRRPCRGRAGTPPRAACPGDTQRRRGTDPSRPCRARRRRPARRRESRARGRRRSGGAGFPGQRGGDDRGILSRRETTGRGRCRRAAGAAPQLRLPRRLGAQRHGARAGRAHGATHRIWGDRPEPRRRAARNRLHARHPRFREHAGAGDDGGRAVRADRQSAARTAADRLAALRGRARGRAVAGSTSCAPTRPAR